MMIKFIKITGMEEVASKNVLGQEIAILTVNI